MREIGEELGCVVDVTGALDGTSAIAADLQLRVVTARLAQGDPVPREHDAVRWLRADELDEVTWAEADVPFLDPLRDLHGTTADARASSSTRTTRERCVARLLRDGFDATCEREPFAGEDDDEDHPWVVATDAPVVMLELLVEEYDGWLEPDELPPPPTPLVLPTPHAG